MLTKIILFPEPAPDPLEQTQEEFELKAIGFGKGFNPFGASANQLAVEMEQMASDVAAAADSLDSAEWVAGAYEEGEVRWSPINHYNYRRRVTGNSATDPSLDPAGWALLTRTTAGGSDTVTSAVDINLSANGGRLQVISMTAPDKKVFMPSATGLEKGVPIRVIRNGGQYRFALNNNVGAFLCLLEPGQVVAMGCSDTSTAAGIWTISGTSGNINSGQPEVLSAVDTKLIAVDMLTSTKAVCAYKNNTTGFLEVVVVNSGSDSGDPVVVSNHAVRNISIAVQSSSQVTVVYQQTANSNIKGYVIGITGNVPTPGPIADIHTAGTATPEGTGLVALSATQLLCTYNAGAVQVRERVLDLTSNTISGISGEVNADMSSSGYIYQYPRKITANKALVAFIGTSGQVHLRLQTITGSTPAPSGAVLTIIPPGSTGIKTAFAALIMNQLRAVIVKPTSADVGGLVVYIVDISGSTPSIVAAKRINLNLPVTNTHIVAATKLDSNKIYVSFVGGFSGGIDALTLAITAEDRVLVSDITERLEPGIASENGNLACAALDASHAIQLYRNTATFLGAKTIEIN